jgi:hypothetical protein
VRYLTILKSTIWFGMKTFLHWAKMQKSHQNGKAQQKLQKSTTRMPVFCSQTAKQKF